MKDYIEILGARENNLQNIDLKFKKNNLIVITGVSGSGKSSLAFNTIYAEGQRRYMESFSAYARSFIGDIQRPDIDKINGLSPVISIEQKTTSKNPRSTVGTLTEIYDFLRLLYARASIAYSYLSGKKMVKQNIDQIIFNVNKDFSNKTVSILAPIIKSRKGHYKELFQQIRKKGFANVRVDGEIIEITKNLQLDRYSIHDIEIVIDKLFIDDNNNKRLLNSISIALKSGDGTMYVLDSDNKANFYSKNLVDPSTGLSFDEPSPNSFSFNSPYGWCESCKGLGIVDEVLKDSIIEDTNKSISRGGIIPLGEFKDVWIFKKIHSILKKHNLDISTPINEIPEKVLNIILYGDEDDVAVNSKKYPGTLWYVKYNGVVDYMLKSRNSKSNKIKEFMDEFFSKKKCSSCDGKRLKKESLSFKINNKSISDLNQMDILKLSSWLSTAEKKLNDSQKIIAKPIFKEIIQRVDFLKNLGLTYLSLDRPLRSLSGGEAQRIRLATQIGTQLVGVLYILDEPSIGLHQRDNVKLIKSLKDLRDLGNTVIVVEHDRDMMLEADNIIDIGPGPGVDGGKVVAMGSPNKFLKLESITSNFLNRRVDIKIPPVRRTGNGKFLNILEAEGNNLKKINCSIPLGLMVSITGVSGSGKSSLIHETISPILKAHLNRSRKIPLKYFSCQGIENLNKIIEVDQSPIGRTPRSNPATYTGVFTDIRNLFASLPESKIRGLKQGAFSFNVKGGRCENCRGAGLRLVEMDFLPSVFVNCEVCEGKRYNRDTLEVRFKGKSISDALNMTVSLAVEFFKNQPKIANKLKSLDDVGLGYISLGQHATTLSGGEAQRVKLSSELNKKDTGKTLFLLDEPTTGLHFQDIQNLMLVLDKLVERGNTVLIIEHNIDVIKCSDYIIDLGPEGGDKGGEIICSGTPEKIAQSKKSYTGYFLKKEFSIK
jgi:excinuclease ABC subunit A|tara:strand:+ start:18356 stop:21169 length:2814 start_codon:yes stop_codon:yes gene_type:complete